MSSQKHSDQNYSSPPLSSNTFFCKTLSRWGLLSYWQEWPSCLSCWRLLLHLCPWVHQWKSLTSDIQAILIGDNSCAIPSPRLSSTKVFFSSSIHFLIPGGVGELATVVVLKDSPHACCKTVVESAKGRGLFWWVLRILRLSLSTTTGRFKQEHAPLLMTHYLGRT